MAEEIVWIVAIIAILVYSLVKLRYSKDPKDELLKAKRLLDENLISEDDYQKIKNKLVKRIVDE